MGRKKIAVLVRTAIRRPVFAINVYAAAFLSVIPAATARHPSVKSSKRDGSGVEMTGVPGVFAP